MNARKLGQPDPMYGEARVQWLIQYSNASALAVRKGGDSYYDNLFEREARAKVARWENDLSRRYPKEYKKGVNLCAVKAGRKAKVRRKKRR